MAEKLLVKKYSMEEATDIFTSSFNHLLSNLDESANGTVLEFLTLVVGHFNPHVMLSTDNLGSLQLAVFEEPIVRDFVLSLKFLFFSRWVQGRGMAVIEALIDDLALGVSYDCGLDKHVNAVDQSANIIPPQLKDALTQYEDSLNVLRANPWIICLLLTQLCINLDNFDNTKPKAGRVAKGNK